MRSLRRRHLARHRDAGRTMGILAALNLLLACDAQRTITSEAAQYTLAVRVQLPASLSAVGQSLGWSGGNIPGARVIAVRRSTDSSELPVADTAVSDAQGIARFLTLARGSYALRLDRTFTSEERVRASATLGDVDALVNTAAVTLADSASAALDVALNPTGGSSLIFTEIAPAWPPGKSGNQYYYGGYFRITNNSDTVVALASKVWFDAYGGFIRNTTIPDGCSYFMTLERDPGGVWARWIYRFPAGAKPLAPGASVLLATDAIDHRNFGGAGFHDLSQAQFEFVFGSDVDNPLSQNMISVAPREYDFMHGWRFRGGRQVWGLAAPLSLDTLPRISRLPADASQSTWIRIPTLRCLSSCATTGTFRSPILRRWIVLHRSKVTWMLQMLCCSAWRTLSPFTGASRARYRTAALSSSVHATHKRTGSRVRRHLAESHRYSMTAEEERLTFRRKVCESHQPRAQLVVMLLLAGHLLVACDAQRTITSEQSNYPLAVRVQLPATLSAVGQALGWPISGVPGARVIAVRRTADPPVADTALSDTQGVAQFSRLTRASYVVRIDRPFSSDERARAAAAIGDADGLVSSVSVTVGDSANASVEIAVSTVGGSSLVISEVFPSFPPEPSRQQYYVGGYLEIHNNADTTIAMARKLFLEIWDGYLTAPIRPNGCSIFSAIERDPANVWAQHLYRFPDSTRALAPGETAVLATDGIDHRPFGKAGFFDLTIASAEFPGSSDVDNPLVPNMIDLSPRPLEADGHGWRFRGGRQVWGLAIELKADTLARWSDAVFGLVLMRIPRAAILDLVRYNWDVVTSTPDINNCPSAIASGIDRADAVLLNVEDTLAIHRRVSRKLPNGRIVYQRSHNSAADWIAGKATPGVIP